MATSVLESNLVRIRLKQWCRTHGKHSAADTQSPLCWHIAIALNLGVLKTRCACPELRACMLGNSMLSRLYSEKEQPNSLWSRAD